MTNVWPPRKVIHMFDVAEFFFFVASLDYVSDSGIVKKERGGGGEDGQMVGDDPDESEHGSNKIK